MLVARVMKRGAPLLLLILLACDRAPAVEKPTAPPGEVWITPGQLGEADLATEPVAERAIGSIRTSAVLALDERRVARVFSPLDGQVVAVSASVGQHVRKGDALVTLDAPDLRRALDNVHRAEAERIAAQHDYTRMKDLNSSCRGMVNLEPAEDRYRIATVNLEHARAEVRLLPAGGGAGGRYVLRAPIDGEVLARKVGPGPVYRSRGGGSEPAPLFTIGDQAELWALADVPAMAGVEPGQKVAARLPARADEVFESTVDWVARVVDPTTGSVRMRCTVPNPTGELRPDLEATLVVATAAKTLAVPRSSVVRQGGQAVVFVRAGQGAGATLRFERRAVEVDEDAAGPWVAVRAGVEKDEQVVRNGAVLVAGP